MNNFISKWVVTGYAMHTVAGTESDFNYDLSAGYTQSISRDWTNFVDNTDIQLLCNWIKKTIDRGLKIAKLQENSGYILSIVIASNFFESGFWGENDNNSNRITENYIINYLKSAYPITGTIAANSTACSSGGSAIVTACQLIDDNKTDIAIVLGYDIESEVPKNGMKRIGALSKEKIAPFSAGRTGTDLADGIGVMIIEKSSVSRARGANVYAGIAGYGVNSDAYNVTSPDPSGISLVNAMKNAIKMSKIPINEISYINAHGSGTKLNDVIETKAIKDVFNDHAYNLFVNSSKSLIGHTLGAAGLIEVIITIMQMNEGVIHQTANFLGNDIACDLNYCFEKKVVYPVKYAISNAIGFGGTNVSILIESGIDYEKKGCNI